MNVSEYLNSKREFTHFVEKSPGTGGRDLPDSSFDKDQLEMGIEVEMEHTDDKEEAKKIAKDHLVEFSDYYTRLKKMEDEAEEETQ